MKYSCPRIVQGRLAIEELTMAQFLLIREFIRICERDGKWPNPDFGTPVNPRIDELLDEINKIIKEDQTSGQTMKLRIPIKDVAQSPAQWTDGQLTVSGVSYDSFVQMFRDLPRGTQSRLLARLTQTASETPNT